MFEPMNPAPPVTSTRVNGLGVMTSCLLPPHNAPHEVGVTENDANDFSDTLGTS
jgi:hypothetical protein